MAQDVFSERGQRRMRLLITGGSGFIGTNTVKHFLNVGTELLNLDLQEPLDSTQRPFWRPADILDPAQVRQPLADFKPTHLIHLAARTDCVENVDLHTEYRANIAGTSNVLDAIRTTPSIERVIITSSQYVCGPQLVPTSPQEYGPHTVYGQSKVFTEQLTRQANLPCCWTLTRPTNIWGPWHMRYRREAWRVMRKGLYLHPGGNPVVRCYGYVGSIVEHMGQILTRPAEQVNGRTFYLSDPPADIYQWADAFCLALRGRRARRVPRSILRTIAIAGDVFAAITGRSFPLTTSRYRSMTSDYIVPMDWGKGILSAPPRTLQENVRETVDWLNEYGWPK